MPPLTPDGKTAPKPKKVKAKPKPKPKPKPVKIHGRMGAPTKPKPRPKPKPKSQVHRKPAGAPGERPKKHKTGGGHKPHLVQGKPPSRHAAEAQNRANVRATAPPKPRAHPFPHGAQIMYEHNRDQNRLDAADRRAQRIAHNAGAFVRELNPNFSRKVDRTIKKGKKGGFEKAEYWNQLYNEALWRKTHLHRPNHPDEIYIRPTDYHSAILTPDERAKLRAGGEEGRIYATTRDILMRDARRETNENFDRVWKAKQALERHIEKQTTPKALAKKFKKNADEAHAYIVRYKLRDPKTGKITGALLTPEDARILFLDPVHGFFKTKNGKPTLPTPWEIKIIQSYLKENGFKKIKVNGSLAGENGSKTMSDLWFVMKQLRKREKKAAIHELVDQIYDTHMIGPKGYLKGFGKVGDAKELYKALLTGHNKNVAPEELDEMLAALGIAARKYADQRAVWDMAWTSFSNTDLSVKQFKDHEEALARRMADEQRNRGVFGTVMSWMNSAADAFQDLIYAGSSAMGYGSGVGGSVTQVSHHGPMSTSEARLKREIFENHHPWFGIANDFILDPLNFIPFGLIAKGVAVPLKIVDKWIQIYKNSTNVIVKVAAHVVDTPGSFVRIVAKAHENFWSDLRKTAATGDTMPLPTLYRFGERATGYAKHARAEALKTLNKAARLHWVKPSKRVSLKAIAKSLSGTYVAVNPFHLLKTKLEHTKILTPDGAGNPLLVVQGSKNNFTHLGESTGYLFTERPLDLVSISDQELAVHARSNSLDEEIVSSLKHGVYLKVVNPLDISSFKTVKGFVGEINRAFTRMAVKGRSSDVKRFRAFVRDLQAHPRSTIREIIEEAPPNFFREVLKDRGFDGLIMEADDGLKNFLVWDDVDQAVPAFEPEQLKGGMLSGEATPEIRGVPTEMTTTHAEYHDFIRRNIEKIVPNLFKALEKLRYPLIDESGDWTALGRLLDATMSEEGRAWVIQNKAHSIAHSFALRDQAEFAQKWASTASQREIDEAYDQAYVRIFENIRAKAGVYSIGNAPPKLEAIIAHEHEYYLRLWREHVMVGLDDALKKQFDTWGGVRNLDKITPDEVYKMTKAIGAERFLHKETVRMKSAIWGKGGPHGFSLDEARLMMDREAERAANSIQSDYEMRTMYGESIDPKDIELFKDQRAKEIGENWMLESSHHEGGSPDLWVDRRQYIDVPLSQVRHYVSLIPSSAFTHGKFSPKPYIEKLKAEERWARKVVRNLDINEPPPVDYLHTQIEWMLDEERFIDNFALGGDRRLVAEELSQISRQRQFQRTLLQDEMQALPGVIGLADPEWLWKNYSHLRASFTPSELQEFRNIVRSKEALTQTINQHLLPKVLAKQFAYWQALSEAHNLGLRALYMGMYTGLTVWRFATLPARPGWTVANILDNWSKAVIKGLGNPKYWWQASKQPGKYVKTIFDAIVGGNLNAMGFIVAHMDKKFGTNVSPHFHNLVDLIWKTPSRELTKLFNAQGISLPEEAISSSLLMREMQRKGIKTVKGYYLDWLRENNIPFEPFHANPRMDLKKVVWNDAKKKEFGFYFDEEQFQQLKLELGLPENFTVKVKWTKTGERDPWGQFSLANDEITIFLRKEWVKESTSSWQRAQDFQQFMSSLITHELRHAHVKYKPNFLFRTLKPKIKPGPSQGGTNIAYRFSIHEQDARTVGSLMRETTPPLVWPVNRGGRAMGTSSRQWGKDVEEFAIRHGAPPKKELGYAFRFKGALRSFHDHAWDLMGNKPEAFAKRFVYKEAFTKAKKAGLTDFQAMEKAWKAIEDTLFDYSKITRLEQNLFIFAPFVQFFRKNTTFWIKNSIRHPVIPAQLMHFEMMMQQVNGDGDPRLARYLTSKQISDLLDLVPGMGWLAGYVGDREFMVDPIQLFSFAPLWRAFKSENPYLSPEDAGLPFISSLIDALADWGLMLNPFLRKPLEWAGILNSRTWQSIFPQTSILQFLTHEFWSSRFPHGLNLEVWLESEIFELVGKDPNKVANDINYYVQLEMAAQAYRGEKVDRKKARETVENFLLVNQALGYFTHIYSRRADPADFYYGQLAEQMKYGLLNLNDLPPDIRQNYYLFKNRGFDPTAYDRYVNLLPVIKSYYNAPSFDKAQEFLFEHPEIAEWVNKYYRGKNPSAHYVATQILSSETSEFFDLKDTFKRIGVPFENRHMMEQAFITPELAAFWHKNDTPHDKRMKILQGKVAHYYTSLTKQYFALPETEQGYAARAALLQQYPDLQYFWDLNNKPSDDMHAIYRSLQISVRERLFEFYEKKDFDGAIKWIEQHPYLFDHTQSEAKYRKIAKVGHFPGWHEFGGGSFDGGSHQMTQHAKDYLAARSALNHYFSLSPDARRAWLAKGGSQAQKVLAYFHKYASGSKKLSAHAKSYLAAKKYLDHYFSLSKEARQKWLNGNSKGAKIVRAYFNKWVVGGDSRHETQKSKDFQNARVALNYYFSLPEGKRYAWLHSGAPLAKEALAYLEKYGKPQEQSQHSIDYLAVKDLLVDFFKLDDKGRAAFLKAHPELQAYFDKYAVEGGQSQHAIDFLAVKDLLDFYFKMDKEHRRAWLNSGGVDSNKVLAYFKKYSTQNSIERSFADTTRQTYYRPRPRRPQQSRQQQRSVNPAVNKRLDFWRIYFSLPPDERAAFVAEHGEEYGVFIYGADFGDEFVNEEITEWMQGAFVHGSESERATLYSLVAPLLDFYYSLDDPGERDMFRRLNPDLDHYLREFVWDSISGDPELDKLLQQYFSLPRGSRDRALFLEQNPTIKAYFEEHNEPADQAIQDLIEEYFAQPNAAAKKDYAAQHPEVREYFDSIKAAKDELNAQLAAFDENDPRTKEIRDKAEAEIVYAAWLKKYLASLEKFAKLAPKGLESRRERRPLVT